MNVLVVETSKNLNFYHLLRNPNKTIQPSHEDKPLTANMKNLVTFITNTNFISNEIKKKRNVKQPSTLPL